MWNGAGWRGTPLTQGISDREVIRPVLGGSMLVPGAQSPVRGRTSQRSPSRAVLKVTSKSCRLGREGSVLLQGPGSGLAVVWTCGLATGVGDPGMESEGSRGRKVTMRSRQRGRSLGLGLWNRCGCVWSTVREVGLVGAWGRVPGVPRTVLRVRKHVQNLPVIVIGYCSVTT